MYRLRPLLLILFALFPLLNSSIAQSPTPKQKPILLSFQKPRMGTLFTIRLWSTPADSQKARAAADAAFEEIGRLNSILSDYELNSELLLITRKPKNTWLPASEDFINILSLSQQLSIATNGAFDVTAGPHIRNWRLSKRDRRLPRPERIQDAFSKTGYQKVAIDLKNKTVKFAVDGMRLDFGGIAKGYAADAALAILTQRGFPRAIVAGSGDIVVGDAPPGHPEGWAIGIRSLDQEDSKKLTDTVLLTHAAVSTSGDLQQFLDIDGKRYSHIVDPKTGLGLTERIGVTIIGPNAVTTDSTATAVSVMGKTRGLAYIEKQPHLECLIVAKDDDGKDTFTESSGFGEKRAK
ncbi:MAG: FAD:protein FMN transferase [Verrucomicrobiales bacterium]|nr:FAD:protein FMN transferase [Verrucomicrobiales bacterium]